MKIWNKINSWLSNIAGSLIFISMFVIFIDVILRYIFNSPMISVFDFVTLIIPIIVFLPMTYTEICKKHIRVDLLSYLPYNNINQYTDMLNYFIGIILFSCMIWAWSDYTLTSVLTLEISQNIAEIPV